MMLRGGETHGAFCDIIHVAFNWNHVVLLMLQKSGDQTPVAFHLPTVDGSEIPNNHLGCFFNPVNNGISTTNLNW